MKKSFIILFLVLGFFMSVHSQGITEKVKGTVTSTAATVNKQVTDVKGTATTIMGKLTSALSLTDVQKPKVLTTVTSLLQQKSAIAGLATKDKAAYAAKLAPIMTGFDSKLKGILTTAQYTKFLNLKPPKATATNVLSQLFY